MRTTGIAAQSRRSTGIDWRRLRRAVRARKRVSLLVGASFFLGAAIQIQLLAPLYTATSVVALTPQREARIAGDEGVDLRMPRYTVQLQSAAALADVERRLGLTEGALEAENVDLAFEAGSAPLSIRVTMRSPFEASQAAAELAGYVVSGAETDPLVDAEIVSRPTPPNESSAPRRGWLTLAALGAAFVIGTSAAVAAELRSPRLRTSHEIRAATELTVLGHIPTSRVFRTRPRETLNHPDVGSAFRAMRSVILRTLPPRPTSIAFTSATRGEGCSTVAASFAESLARSGERVLLVDADMDRGALSRRFKLDAHRSLGAALRGTARLEDASKRGWVDGLTVLTTRADREASDLLATRFAGLLSEARLRFDVVVIDCAPVLISPDARVIVKLAAATVLVTRTGVDAAHTTQASNTLQELDVNLLGVVANGVPGDEEADYYFAYVLQGSAAR